MSPELFHETFFFFSRCEAEKLRLVCRHFNALCNGLRDVHGYKLQIDQLSIWYADELKTSKSGPAEYCALILAYGQRHQIQGSEEELAAALKATLSVSLVGLAYICNSALNESLCDEPAAVFGGVSAEIVRFSENDHRGYRSAYYQSVTSSKISSLLLSFGAIGQLQVYTKLRDDDLADEFILACRTKRVRTLALRVD
ncbi:hypothetical protein AAVH_41769, partial [Aphelenchoides avenae]